MFDGTRDILRRYGETITAAWRHRRDDPVSARRRDEADFLPAMLEIQESPPHPMARATMYLILLLFCIAVAWMILGRIDIVATAAGKILPDNRIKLVQSVQSGIVKSIRVSDGDPVRAGDLLLELDGTANDADLSNLRNELTESRLESEMTRLLAAWPPAAATPPTLRPQPDWQPIPPARAAAQQGALNNLFYEQKSRREQIQDDIAGLQADLRLEKQGVLNARQQLRQNQRATEQRLQGESYQLEKTTALLPIAQNEYESFKSLYEQNVVSRLQMQQAQEKYLSLQKDLQYQQNQLIEIQTAGDTEQMQHAQRAQEFENRIYALSVRIAAKEQSLVVEQTRHRREMDDRHQTAKRRIHELQQQLVKAEQQQQFHRIVAPADGIVQQLKIHTRGAVVQAAEALLVIVPLDRTLEVEAYVENKDIGFVHVGQAVEIKIDAFPYTKFGLVGGTVTHLSADAIEDEKRGLVYQAKIRLRDNALTVNGEQKPLAPGMSVVAEIKTGQRRVIEFFMAPLIQHGKESLGER